MMTFEFSLLAYTEWVFGPILGAMATSARDQEETGVDENLVSEIAEGDNFAMSRLVNRWKRPLISYFYRSLSSLEDAEDLTLEVLIRVQRAAGRYNAKAKFSTYLFTIARRLLLNELRRRKRKPVELLEPAELHYLATTSDEETQNLAELEEVFQKALLELPERYRTPLLLAKQESLSSREIAKVIGVSENNLRVTIHRGRKLLKEKMEEML